MHVLIVGVSTRAAAESAARAGYAVTALDAYADIDQHRSVRALSLPRDFGQPYSPLAVVAAARDLPGDAVVYLSSFENHPAEVDALAAGRALWGNPSSVLRRVRDPRMLADAFARRGIRVPHVLSTKKERIERTAGAERWVSKPRSSGGGHGVQPWRAGQPVARGHYLQEFVEGSPGSVVFAAAGGPGVALATSRQLVGDRAFGASGFRYCGNMLSPINADVVVPAIALVEAVTAFFPLVGLGTIDFVATAAGLSPLEVNPRWSASMELVERARGLSMFSIHADACAKGVLPEFDLRDAATTETHGKAILFARRDVVIHDLRESFDEGSVRDVPRPGDRIAVGQPICTVLASGPDDASCYARLVERAESVYGVLDRPK